MEKQNDQIELIQLIIELIPTQFWYIDPITERDYCRLSFQVCNVLMTIDLHYKLFVDVSEIDQETGEVDVSHSIEDIEIVDFQISRVKGMSFDFSDETYKLLTEQILLKIIKENE